MTNTDKVEQEAILHAADATVETMLIGAAITAYAAAVSEFLKTQKMSKAAIHRIILKLNTRAISLLETELRTQQAKMALYGKLKPSKPE